LLDKIPPILKNKYVIAIIVFFIWILFFDRNNLINHTADTYAISMDTGAFNVSFINNTILNSGDNTTVFLNSGSDRLDFINNTVNATNAVGIFTYPGDLTYTFEGNVIETAGAADHHGINLNGFSGTIIIKNSRITSSGIALYNDLYYALGANLVLVNDTILNSTNNNDLSIYDGVDGIMNFTNVTMNYSNMNWGTGGNVSLNVFWYLNVNVTNTTGDPIDSAGVNVTNKDGVLVYNGQTQASGLTTSKALQEYWRNETDNYYYSNYTVTANKSGYAKNYAYVNMTTNKLAGITMSGDIDSCRDLDSANTTYILTQDVNSSGTCFEIKANNITLDCQGYNITYCEPSLGERLHRSSHDQLQQTRVFKQHYKFQPVIWHIHQL